jgi:hypothetical protein
MATESSLRYIKLDYQSHKDALLQRIRERYPNTWNDFLANSFGIVLVDIIAWGLATLAFMLNFIGAENFLSTMKLRESAVRLGRLVNYNLQSPVPASVSCEAALDTVSTSNVLIKKGTLVRTSNDLGLPFEVAQDYQILAGNLTPRTLVVTFSPSQAGANVLNTFVNVTTGSVNVDMVDSTINLSQFVQVGQTFSVTGTDLYTIQSIEKAPGAVSDYSRLVLDRAYSGATAAVDAYVIDTRILLVQGQTVVERYVAASGSTAGFSLKLSRTPVIDNSVIVTVSGEVWTQSDSVAVAGSFDKNYQVRTLTNGVTVVIFGDGVFGALLPSEAPISITYRVGGGVTGNVELNVINTSFTGYIENIASPVTVMLKNSTATGIGGQDAETLDQARVNIPYYARTNDRAVTLGDYQTMAQRYSDAQFGSVAYARSSVRRDNALLEGNIVAVYAWTTGVSGGLVPLSPQLKLVLQDYLQTKSIGTDFVQVYDGTSRPVPISLRFRVFDGFSITDTKRLVTDTIRAYVNTLRPGDPIFYSNLLRAVDETYGVDTVNMATPISDLYPSNDLELFSVPQDTFVYALQKTAASAPKDDLTGSGNVSLYAAQLPVYPMAAWSFRLFLGTSELTVVPYTTPGYARLFGLNLSTANTVTTGGETTNFNSTVNLLTGQVQLWIKGAPGDLTMRLTTVQGYSTERVVNAYIGYIGENTQTKRREIRSALRSWSDGIGIGSAMYARQVSGVSASQVSVTDVVVAVTGVQSVTRVALGTPANNDDRVTAADFEVLRIGNVIINNQAD